jgi:hypothetical protein
VRIKTNTAEPDSLMSTNTRIVHESSPYATRIRLNLFDSPITAESHQVASLRESSTNSPDRHFAVIRDRRFNPRSKSEWLELNASGSDLRTKAATFQ